MRLFLLTGLFGLLCSAQMKPAFEVASVKPSSEGEENGLSISIRDGRLTVRNMDLYNLIQTAYQLRAIQMQDVPSWTKSVRFDIQARATDSDASDEQVRIMMQSLLEDRFKLKSHRVAREQSAYALSVAEGGPKLPAAGERRNGTLRLGSVESPSLTMQTLCSLLEFELERPVQDRTGVTAPFAIHLEWASEKIPGDAASTKPSLVTALREQLGLKLESARVPVEMFVVDSVEQRPSEN